MWSYNNRVWPLGMPSFCKYLFNNLFNQIQLYQIVFNLLLVCLVLSLWLQRVPERAKRSPFLYEGTIYPHLRLNSLSSLAQIIIESHPGTPTAVHCKRSLQWRRWWRWRWWRWTWETLREEKRSPGQDCNYTRTQDYQGTDLRKRAYRILVIKSYPLFSFSRVSNG